MIYALLAALVFGALGGFYGGSSWEGGRWAKADNARIAAEAKVDAIAAEASQQAANKITDMEAAYEAGQAKAKTVYVKVQAKGASDVRTYPVFSNRDCDWPTDSVQLVNSAFANLRTPSDTRIPASGLPAAATVAGGPAGSGLFVGVKPAGTVDAVHADARATDSGGALPAAGSGRPPKPTPRAK